MDFDMNMVKKIGTVVLSLLLIAVIAVLIIPIMYGVGDKAATSMGVSTSTTYNNSVLALESTSSTQKDVFSFLPWLGVGVVILGAILKDKISI